MKFCTLAQTFNARSLVSVFVLLLLLAPVAPVLVSKVHARPPNGVNLPAADGIYNAASYITNEYWGQTAQSCGYAYDTQGGTDSTGWTTIDCTTNIPIPPPSGDGPHVLYISAWDNPDYTGFQYNWSVSFTYDNTPPPIIINSPMDNSEIADADWANPSIAWGDSSTCEYHLDSDPYQTPGSTCGPDIDMTKPAPGSHTLYVRGTDVAGNQTEQSISFTLDAPIDNGGGPPATTAPTVTFDTPTSITQTGIVLHGIVTNDGGDVVNDWGVSYGRTSAVDQNSYEHRVGADLGAGTNFSSTLSGLTCSTKYYYRTWAGSASGYGQSDESSFMTSDCASDDITSGLVADWEFNDGSGTSATDSTGNGNTGTLNGGSTWGVGKTSGGITFDGTGYVTVASPSLIPVGSSPYTLSAWIKTTGTNGQGIIGWGDYGTQSATNAFRLASYGDCNGGNGLDNYWWGNDVVGCANNGTNLYDGTWHHVVTEYDGNARQIYIDGTLVTFDNPIPINVTRDDNITIGATYLGNSENFNGTIDNVRVYNRALSDPQIAALYAVDGGSGGGGSPAPELGDGSLGNPFQITSCAQLEAVNQDVSKSYVLENDLDCSADGNAAMMGAISTPFTGHFDGLNHTIKVNISQSSGVAGLFGYTSNATISNVNVTGAVAGVSHVGGLSGIDISSTIHHVSSSATVSGSGVVVGGLIGYTSGTILYEAYTQGAVSAASFVGGLIGDANSITVTDAYASGSVTGGDNTGGLIGHAISGPGSFINVFAAGLVTENAGGSVGGLVGNTVSAGTIVNGYFSAGNTGQSYCAGNASADGCTEEFSLGTDQYFFYQEHPPMSSWDYSVYGWQVNDGDYPTFSAGFVLPPSVTTGTTTDISTGLTSEIVQLGLTINSVSASSITTIGVQYGTDTNYGSIAQSTVSPYSAGQYVVEADEMTCGTTYHYRAFIVDGVSTTYGADRSFTTNDCETVTIASPAAKTTITESGWHPSVSFSNAFVTCEYAYDGASYTQLDSCTSTIPAPESSGAHTLYIKGIDGSNQELAESVDFTYSSQSTFEGFGAGTTENPYQVTSCLQLQQMDTAPQATYDLQNNIDCSDTQNWNDGRGFNPVQFSGVLNGHGHGIQSLTINRPTEPVAGLFNYLDGQVYSLHLDGGSITGDFAVGSIAGVAGNTQVVGVSSSASVYSNDSNQNQLDALGGLFGYVQDLIIQKSSFTGTASSNGETVVGGLIGEVDGGAQISDSFSNANMEGFATGGLIGYINGDTDGVSITRTYSAGQLFGYVVAGGFVSASTENGGPSAASTIISSSFSVATLYSANAPVGGIYGYLDLTNPQFNSVYYDVTATGNGNCVAALGDPEGCTPVNIDGTDSSRYINTSDPSIGPLGDFDFSTVWSIADGMYPQLQALGSVGFATAPTIVTATAATTDGLSIPFSWTAPSDTGGFSIQSYQYYLQPHGDTLNPGDEGAFASTTDSSATSDVIINSYYLSYGSSYDLRIRAVTSYGNGAWSDPVTITFGAAPHAPEDVPVVRSTGGGSSGSGGGTIQNNRSASSSPSVSRSQLLEQVATLKAKLAAVLGQSTDPRLAAPLNLTVRMKGTNVAALQTLLIAQDAGPASKKLAKLGATGYFSLATRAALIEYQKAYGITPATGYFGSLTRAQMKAAGLDGLWW